LGGGGGGGRRPGAGLLVKGVAFNPGSRRREIFNLSDGGGKTHPEQMEGGDTDLSEKKVGFSRLRKGGKDPLWAIMHGFAEGGGRRKKGLGLSKGRGGGP